jgi:phosphonatase-like hydrolase
LKGAPLKEIRLVVSDMAGTTVKDSGEVARAFAAALADHGVETSAEQINAVRGASKREAIATLVAPKYGTDAVRVEAVYGAFKNHLQRVFTREAEPVDGAIDTFAWLRERGIKLVLNTGFDRDITGILLDALHWRDVADAVICGDDVPQGRPAPYMIFRAMEATATGDVRQVLNIGDTVSDLQAARNAGVAVSVGVLSGAHKREQLMREPHTCLVGSVADLPGLWG